MYVLWAHVSACGIWVSSMSLWAVHVCGVHSVYIVCVYSMCTVLACVQCVSEVCVCVYAVRCVRMCVCVPCVPLLLSFVFTPDMKGSGTDADVFLNMFGENGDTGERRLDNDKNNFEKGSEDKFTIDSPNLGRLQKITIGHNNKGSSAGWFLDKVCIDDIGNKTLYEFPVNRWFAMDEDDGKIQRDVLVGGMHATGIVYNVSVITGDVRGAGTNSKIHILLHGTKGMKNSGKIFLEGGQFERAQIDIFNVEIAALLSPLSRVTIGHDNCGVSSGWFCEKVVVYCPFTGIEQTFPCGKWLDEDEGDGLIERELYEMVSLRQKRQKKHPWSLWIWTSDIKSAGTDASVFLQIYGDKGKSNEMRLDNNSDNFENGQIDKFMIELPDLGILTKLRIWHEKRHPFAGWHLNRVSLLKSLTQEKYDFKCNRWLDMNEDDHEIIRELTAEGPLVPNVLPVLKYRVVIYTGTKSGSGTDANVYICLVGELGDTGERALYDSKNNVNKFEKANADEFLIESVKLGRVKRVRVGHDGRGGTCGWYLDKVVVKEETAPESQAVEFPCNRWLDRNEDDGQIVRELVPAGDAQMLKNISYHVLVKTGNVAGASSDSKVFIKLYGEKGDTSRQFLVVSDNDLRNYFERGRVDIFTVETMDIGRIHRLLIGHDNVGLRAGWFLDSVQIKVPTHGKEYMFPSHRWLCRDEADGKTEIEIYPSEVLEIEKLINYEVQVQTGNVRSAGTNAQIFIQIYGENGKTEVIDLRSRSDNFERAAMDIFKQIQATDVGKLIKIRIGHDGSGMGDGWYLETVSISRLSWRPAAEEKKKKKKNKKKKGAAEEEETPSGGEEVVETFTFLCQRWLATDEEDGELVVELLPEGVEDLEENSYEVHVFTGKVTGAGTDANVFINIYGEVGDTGERQLRKSGNLNKFEKGQEDVFMLKAADLGTLKKLRIRHDNSSGSAGWFLNEVEIVDLKDDTLYFFPCERWLAVDEDDGQIARELVPVNEAFLKKGSDDEFGAGVYNCVYNQCSLYLAAQSTTYTVRVKTGDKKNAGTDSNIFINLYGEHDDTGVVNLKSSKMNKNKFERGQVDEFIVEAVDLGPLRKIRVGHNNYGSPGWFLDWVEIDAPSLGRRLRFPCGRWLDKREDDGAIVRDLVPASLQTVEYVPFVPYEITVFTSDRYGAGTDADVSVVLYGLDGVCSQKRSLCVNKRERRMYFKRGATNKFIVELADVGESIEKLRVEHNGRGLNSGWHLDRVEIRRLLPKGKGSETVIFPCERWLAKSEDDGEIVRELVPSTIIQERLQRDGTLACSETDVEEPLETHTYKVSVSTGDVYGAGTDANVFLTVYGDLGDTGERKLSKSEDHSNKFERGQVDTFTMEAVDLGQIYKIRIRHDNTLASAEWYLEQVEVVDENTEEVSVFLCERWLSRTREDKRIDRVLYIKVHHSIHHCLWDAAVLRDLDLSRRVTAGTREAGTMSRAFIIIMGPQRMRTARLWLELPPGKKGFVPGSVENFMVNGLDVGEIKKIEVLYEMTVVNGDIQNAGTDSNIYMTVFGANGSTDEMLLDKNGDRFERGQEDVFVIEIEDIAPLRKIRIRTETKGNRPDWFLDKIILRNLSTEDVSTFTNNEWLSRTRGSKPTTVCEMGAVIEGEETVEKTTYSFSVKTSDVSGQTLARPRGHNQDNERTLFPVIQERFIFAEPGVWHTLADVSPAFLQGYEIRTKTSDRDDAESKENVWMVLEGKKGRSKEFMLENSTKRKKGAIDKFEFSSKNVGDIATVCVGHCPRDGKKVTAKSHAHWHVAEIVVTEMEVGNRYVFECNSRVTLSHRRDDFKAFECTKMVESFASKVRNLVPVKYEIIVVTGDVKGAGTDANVFLTIYGTNGNSGCRQLKQKFRNLFERGRTDRFLLEMLDLGELYRLRAEQDGGGHAAGWLLERMEITNIATGVSTIFPCGKWLDSKRGDGRTFREIYPKF
uniref:Lipoxygenase homology PLAT domains 1 n=1 Tax=Callorhinchus milii TaxID=7868 RepID=A0A4W3HXD2_CALMI